MCPNNLCEYLFSVLNPCLKLICFCKGLALANFVMINSAINNKTSNIYSGELAFANKKQHVNLVKCSYLIHSIHDTKLKFAYQLRNMFLPRCLGSWPLNAPSPSMTHVSNWQPTSGFQ